MPGCLARQAREHGGDGHMRRTAVLVTLIVALCGCQGCALFGEKASPEQRWAAAATLYTTTLEALTKLKVAGVLTDEDKARIEPYRKAARAALDAMERAIATEDTSAFGTAWQAFSAAIDVMLSEQAKASVTAGETGGGA